LAKASGGGGSIHGQARIQLTDSYYDIISTENLLEAWSEFVVGKRKRLDVQDFERRLMDNILSLQEDLRDKSYRHSLYKAFKITDPKPRDIHKASVRDRLLHHAIYRKLYPLFERTFIADSYSCRDNKGVHKALERFTRFARIVSRNHTRTAWVLKCDIRKFFASIDHSVLKAIVARYIPDEDILWLLAVIIDSFSSREAGVGLPLGNLTSQLLVNIYMNEFDQFAKHQLKTKHYIRYADDFVIFSEDREWLVSLRPRIEVFLQERLRLVLHPNKVSIATAASGIDFLGWVHFPDHTILRTTTKHRMFSKLGANPDKAEVRNSYLGLLKHGNTKKLKSLVE
jgi:RNA-directed DNA polymerase